MSLPPVAPGDKWQPSATRTTQIHDAVNWVNAQRARQSIGRFTPAAETTRILAVNDSGGDFDLYDAVQISTPIVVPADSEATWRDGPLACLVITPADYKARIAILEEPLPDGAVRSAIVSGVARTKIDIGDTAHRFARVDPGSRRLVSSQGPGFVEILWAASGTGVQFALVRLGHRPAVFRLGKTGSGGIPAGSWDGSCAVFTMGSGTVTIFEEGSTPGEKESTGETETWYNLGADDVAANTLVGAVPDEAGNWVVSVEPCDGACE